MRLSDSDHDLWFELETFRRSGTGDTVLLHVIGKWGATPARQLTDPRLVITSRKRRYYLSLAPETNPVPVATREGARWQAGYTAPQALIRRPDVKFTLEANKAVFTLPAPLDVRGTMTRAPVSLPDEKLELPGTEPARLERELGRQLQERKRELGRQLQERDREIYEMRAEMSTLRSRLTESVEEVARLRLSLARRTDELAELTQATARRNEQLEAQSSAFHSLERALEEARRELDEAQRELEQAQRKKRELEEARTAFEEAQRKNRELEDVVAKRVDSLTEQVMQATEWAVALEERVVSSDREAARIASGVDAAHVAHLGDLRSLTRHLTQATGRAHGLEERIVTSYRETTRIASDIDAVRVAHVGEIRELEEAVAVHVNSLSEKVMRATESAMALEERVGRSDREAARLASDIDAVRVAHVGEIRDLEGEIRGLEEVVAARVAALSDRVRQAVDRASGLRDRVVSSDLEAARIASDIDAVRVAQVGEVRQLEEVVAVRVSSLRERVTQAAERATGLEARLASSDREAARVASDIDAVSGAPLGEVRELEEVVASRVSALSEQVTLATERATGLEARLANSDREAARVASDIDAVTGVLERSELRVESLSTELNELARVRSRMREVTDEREKLERQLQSCNDEALDLNEDLLQVLVRVGGNLEMGDAPSLPAEAVESGSDESPTMRPAKRRRARRN